MKSLNRYVIFLAAVSLALSAYPAFAQDAVSESDLSSDISQNAAADVSADSAVRVTKITLSGVKLSRARFD
ncbi:MAG: hypothetical protein IKN25_06125 [Spirochaetales bacterium]|nr:hypothetical protein [Spirochaetales bacterium]